MPFITEELWHRMGHEMSIALEAYPTAEAALDDSDAEREMNLLQDVTTQVRTQRADRKIDKKLKLAGQYTGPRVDPTLVALGTNVDFTVTTTHEPTFHFVIAFPADSGPTTEELERLRKDNLQLEKLITSSKSQLGNEAFVSKAPAKVIDGMRTKLAEYEAQYAKNKAALGK